MRCTNLTVTATQNNNVIDLKMAFVSSGDEAFW